jgi:alpha-glucosidase (family GH31 glycosyl hydrolase)
MRKLYLPAGTWWDCSTELSPAARIEVGQSVNRTVDLETMPLYVRAGAIIPIGPVRQYTSEPVRDLITLRIYPGADGRFTWYDDDGVSYAHERGEFMRVECVWNEAANTLTLTPDQGGRMTLPSQVRVERADTKEIKAVTLHRTQTKVIF